MMKILQCRSCHKTFKEDEMITKDNSLDSIKNSCPNCKMFPYYSGFKEIDETDREQKLNRIEGAIGCYNAIWYGWTDKDIDAVYQYVLINEERDR